MGVIRQHPLDVKYIDNISTMAIVENYTKLEMSFIKITSIINQIVLMICCSMSLVGFMWDIYNHDVEYNLSEEELLELDETPLMVRAKIFSNLLPAMSIFTGVFVLIAKYNSEKSSKEIDNSW